jgi:hypothetical protein
MATSRQQPQSATTYFGALIAPKRLGVALYLVWRARYKESPMKCRLFIATLASASLLSFAAYAGASNSGHISQHGFGNVAGIGQFAAFGGKNSSSISQYGVANTAVTGQTAVFGGRNNASVSQSGIGNIGVVSQTAF